MAKAEAEKVLIEDDAELEEPELKESDAKLWIRARQKVEDMLGRLPSNRDMVDFARTNEGEFIRHLFPFDRVEESAYRHWVALAGHYTRQAKIVFASDPRQAPQQIRALYVVRDHEGRRGIATAAQVANNRNYADQVISDARRQLEGLTLKYQQVNRVLNNAKIAKAMAHAMDAITELGS
jgi:hypothetical protein